MQSKIDMFEAVELVFWSFGKFDFGRTLVELMRIFGRTYGELTLAPKDKGRAN
jgi:hypothetical protein